MLPVAHLTQVFNQMSPFRGPPPTALLMMHPPSSPALPSILLLLASIAFITTRHTHVVLFTVCLPLKEHRPHGQGVSYAHWLAGSSSD